MVDEADAGLSSGPLQRHSAFGMVGRAAMLRPRLISLLLARFDRRVTVISAGPGFGKTTLLASAKGENELDPRGVDVWLSCRSGDAVESTLATGLLKSLQ